MKTFKAAAMSAMTVSELDCFVVVFAEHPDGSGARLEIQRATSFDEQDISLGMNTYCLSTELGVTCYGGVVSWQLHGPTLRIELDAGAEKILDAEGGYAIDLGVGSEAQSVMREGLAKVLVGVV